jgi:hypothetical protein
MAIIPNFPDALIDQHHHWHDPSAHPGAGPGRTHPAGTAGGGLEFLTFHRNFVAQALAWYNTTNFSQAPFNDATQKAQLVAPWMTVPAELQGDSDWPTWAADAARLDSDNPDFPSADELGTFIEVGIHNQFLHGATAAAFNEPVVGSLHSPQSTFFYKIHGLVDHWWSLWQTHHKIRFKELMKELVKEVIDTPHKRLVEDVKHIAEKEFVTETKDRIADVKLAALDVLEDPRRLGDPVFAETINRRLVRVERQIFPRSATFILPDERPAVGDQVAKKPRRRKKESGGQS